MAIIETILAICGIPAAIGGVLALILKFIHWVDRQKAQDLELKEIREEMTVICFGLLAALDGLKQLGANGNVTKAHDKLDKHLNQKAHK